MPVKDPYTDRWRKSKAVTDPKPPERRRGMKCSQASAVFAAAVVVLVGGCGRSQEETKPPPKLTQTQLIEKVKPSVVRISGNEGGGTGVVVDANRGLVLTNAHVVIGLTGTKAQVGDDKSTEGPAQIVAAAPCEDLAVVRLVNKPRNLKSVEMGDSAQIKAGEHVTALGYPGTLEEDQRTGLAGQSQTMVSTEGSVSAADITASPDPSLPRFTSTIQHAASVNPGNSGGPLVDDQGKLVGVNTLRNSGEAGEVQGQSYAISSDRVKQLLPNLLAGRSQAYIGWSLVPLSQVDVEAEFAADPDFASAKLGRRVQRTLEAPPEDDGMYALKSETGSSADRAGIGYGLLIQTLEGQPVTTQQDVCDIITAKSPGDRVEVGWLNINGTSDVKDIFNRGEFRVRIRE